MKQVVQNYNTGELRLEDVPAPICSAGGVVVRTSYSLISAGTERMKVDQARMSLIAKARARPDKVRQVIQNIRQHGLVETINKVRERLDSLTPLGYSLAGVVVEVGANVDEFAVGDRVACAGEGVACHAEYVSVPRNLCAAVPDTVELRDAAFATVGAIAMNGVRQAGVMLGARVVVIGLGLVGLLAIQILKAAGCCVIGIDLDPQKVALAKQCGADLALQRDDVALEDAVFQITGGDGADAAYVAASTNSADPMVLAGQVVRDRGTVVIVGMIKVEADWQLYYHKELSVVMSRSYGPGRYDRNYEKKGIDYPIGYVRWTERRNLEEFLRLLAMRKVNPGQLGSELFKIGDAAAAYQQLRESPGKHSVGILFEYPSEPSLTRRVASDSPAATSRLTPTAPGVRIGIGMIGAGNFTTSTLIPALKRIPEARLAAICSAGGLSARSAAQRHGFAFCASDFQELLTDRTIQAVVIATHHDSHARMAAEAVRMDKHVLVEKPLALTVEQLDELIEAQAETGRIIMPGFNRRFSPLSIAVRDYFAGRSSPIEVVCRVNAGSIKRDSWYQDVDEGGWRVVSEGCHFVDLIQFICGCSPVRVSAEAIGGSIRGGQNDNCAVTMKMEDGSVGTFVYVANGDPHFEKERVEVFGQGRSAVIENWRRARLSGGGRTRTVSPGSSGKGHRDELREFVAGVATGVSPLPWREAVAATRCTFAIEKSIRSGSPEPVED